jgi:hypothetical protein
LINEPQPFAAVATGLELTESTNPET